MLLHSAVKLPNKVIFSIKDGFLSRKILNSLSELSKVLIILGRLNVDITLVCVCVCVCVHVCVHMSGHAHGIYCFIKKYKRPLCCFVGGWMRSGSASLLQRMVISFEVFRVGFLLTPSRNLCLFSLITLWHFHCDYD